MKPIPTKAELRSRMEAEMEAFLREGGAVKEVPRGVSGHDTGAPPVRPERTPGAADDQPPREERVYLNDVVAAIEARRRPQNVKATAHRTRPKKRLIYDDFGEPLRWEWVEE